MARSSGDLSDTAAATVSLGVRLTRSERFKTLFADGMALVEEAAAYLDGAGRLEARTLQPELAAAYSAESMRLTTRLMQIASWLLIRRAVMDGEMTSDEAQTQRIKVTLSAQHRVSSPAVFAALPASLRGLTERSLGLQQRVLYLDRMVNGETGSDPGAAPNGALAAQHARLRSAYGPGGD